MEAAIENPEITINCDFTPFADDSLEKHIAIYTTSKSANARIVTTEHEDVVHAKIVLRENFPREAPLVLISAEKAELAKVSYLVGNEVAVPCTREWNFKPSFRLVEALSLW